jgi:hypothetical protein
MGHKPPTFAEMAPTWEAAGNVIQSWVPKLSGSAESRIMVAHGKRFLQAVVLHFRQVRPPHRCTAANIYLALEDALSRIPPPLQCTKADKAAAIEHPPSLLRELLASGQYEVRQVAAEALDNLDNPWHGGMRQALLCIPACESSEEA